MAGVAWPAPRLARSTSPAWRDAAEENQETSEAVRPLPRLERGGGLSLSVPIVATVLSVGLLRRSERPAQPKGLPWTASHVHPFDVEVVRPRWPFLFSTALWLPRLRVHLTNVGEDLQRVSVSAEMANYDGDIGSAANAEGWTDVAHFHREDERWDSREQRTLDLRVPANKIPRPGTYLVRLTVTRWRPSGTIREDLVRQLEQQGSTPEEIAAVMEKAQVAEAHLKGAFPDQQLDWDAPRPAQFSGELISTVTVLEYVRVEPFSNVLSFLGFVAAGLTALATLLLVLLTWAGLGVDGPSVIFRPEIVVPVSTTTSTQPPTTSFK